MTEKRGNVNLGVDILKGNEMPMCDSVHENIKKELASGKSRAKAISNAKSIKNEKYQAQRQEQPYI